MTRVTIEAGVKLRKLTSSGSNDRHGDRQFIQRRKLLLISQNL